MLDSGYSWLTNQYGLTIDTVLEFEIVKPNGDIVNVTESSDPDLFFGLKVNLPFNDLVLQIYQVIHTQGGMNNFVSSVYDQCYYSSLQ